MKRIYRYSKQQLQTSMPGLYGMLDKRKIIVKYIISGGAAAATDLILLYLFTEVLKIYYLLSASLAFIIAFFISFFLQKFWTFRDNNRDKMYQQMSLYLAVGVINLAINAGGMYVLVDHILPAYSVAGIEITYILSQIIMGALIAVFSFLIYRFVIFKKLKSKLDESKSNNNLKILIATGIFPPDIGGPATYARALCDELPKLGCELKVVTYGMAQKHLPQLGKSGKNTKTQKYQYELFIINRKQNLLLRYLKYFWQVYKLSKWADVVYVLDLMSAGLPATIAAKAKGKKVVFRTGGDFLWEKAYQDGWTSLPLVKYYEAKKNLREKILLSFCCWILRKINLVIFSTKLQADIYNKYYKVSQDKIKFIANAIPQIGVSSYDSSHNYIVFAGRLIKLKNIERLINAFSRIDNLNIKLLIFGKGPEKNCLENKIKSLKLEDRIKLVGNVSHDKLIKMINGCSFVVLPSLTEISPNLALECLSMAKPIILTKENGLNNEIINQLVTIDPLSENSIKEKMEYLLMPENLSEYSRRLRQINFKKRPWREVSQDHINIFKKLQNE